ncbi:flagellar biosynthesis regulator FlaF [Thioclava sp. JE_KL1]|uniref:flagellar biosynthesis regulator FlaF n=1 Tax=Thioclava sp. JE_KL1 TaxID=2651187 RepID=UPI00128C07B7|nr:flagellar biosynthesis regulator FlaF [Thioclava sp. JE_KL1]MPQ95064.1 flaF protein [Thioclava sp. JE_KL1]
MSVAAYKRTISETESPRQIERRILSRVTGELEAFLADYDSASQAGRGAILAQGLRTALWENERIWTALRDDLAEPANQFPADLKAALISLALWVERETQVVMGGGGAVAPLVEVNRNIIRGLSGDAGEPVAAE